jgi:hypothetical protein
MRSWGGRSRCVGRTGHLNAQATRAADRKP